MSWVQSFGPFLCLTDDIPLVHARSSSIPQDFLHREVVYDSSATYSIEINSLYEISTNALSFLLSFIFFINFTEKMMDIFLEGMLQSCSSYAK